jgi:hypothetical protein
MEIKKEKVLESIKSCFFCAEEMLYKKWIENLEIKSVDEDNIVLIAYSKKQKEVIEMFKYMLEWDNLKISKIEVIEESIGEEEIDFDKDEVLLIVKSMLKREMESIVYNTWIKNLEIDSMDEEKIILIVYSDKQKDAIEKRFNDLLFYTFKYVTKKEKKIEAILK